MRNFFNSKYLCELLHEIVSYEKWSVLACRLSVLHIRKCQMHNDNVTENPKTNKLFRCTNHKLFVMLMIMLKVGMCCIVSMRWCPVFFSSAFMRSYFGCTFTKPIVWMSFVLCAHFFLSKITLYIRFCLFSAICHWLKKLQFTVFVHKWNENRFWYSHWTDDLMGAHAFSF